MAPWVRPTLQSYLNCLKRNQSLKELLSSNWGKTISSLWWDLRLSVQDLWHYPPLNGLFCLSRNDWWTSDAVVTILLRMGGQGHPTPTLTPCTSTKRRTDWRTDGRTDGWTDGRMDGRTDGWTDGWTDRPTDRQRWDDASKEALYNFLHRKSCLR